MTLMLDVSSNNHPATGKPFDYLAAKEAGYGYVYVKATQGDYYINPYMLDDVLGFTRAGFKVGLYHFYDYRIDADVQAAYFKSNGLERVGALPLVWALDYETGTVTSTDEIATFGRYCGEPNITYVDRNFAHLMGPPKGWPIWLAWPGYVEGDDLSPYGTVVAVQYGQGNVAGIGLVDQSLILDAATLGSPAPGAPGPGAPEPGAPGTVETSAPVVAPEPATPGPVETSAPVVAPEPVVEPAPVKYTVTAVLKRSLTLLPGSRFLLTNGDVAYVETKFVMIFTAQGKQVETIWKPKA